MVMKNSVVWMGLFSFVGMFTEYCNPFAAQPRGECWYNGFVYVLM